VKRGTVIIIIIIIDLVISVIQLSI